MNFISSVLSFSEKFSSFLKVSFIKKVLSKQSIKTTTICSRKTTYSQLSFSYPSLMKSLILFQSLILSTQGDLRDKLPKYPRKIQPGDPPKENGCYWRRGKSPLSLEKAKISAKQKRIASWKRLKVNLKPVPLADSEG